MACDLPRTAAVLAGQVSYPETWRRHLIQQTPPNIPRVLPLSERKQIICLSFLPFFHCRFFPGFLSSARKQNLHSSASGQRVLPHALWTIFNHADCSDCKVGVAKPPRLPPKHFSQERELHRVIWHHFCSSSSFFPALRQTRSSLFHTPLIHLPCAAG